MQIETKTVQALVVYPNDRLSIESIPADWEGNIWVTMDARCREIYGHILSRHATYQQAKTAKETAEHARSESE